MGQQQSCLPVAGPEAEEDARIRSQILRFPPLPPVPPDGDNLQFPPVVEFQAKPPPNLPLSGTQPIGERIQHMSSCNSTRSQPQLQLHTPSPALLAPVKPEFTLQSTCTEAEPVYEHLVSQGASSTSPASAEENSTPTLADSLPVVVDQMETVLVAKHITTEREVAEDLAIGTFAHVRSTS